MLNYNTIMDVDIITKEIQECYDGTKDSRDNPYYRGCNDAYVHLIRFLKREDIKNTI